MKSKLRNLLLAAMAITLFASCSNIALDDASVESSETSDKCVLTIDYEDLEGILPETSLKQSARTIDPGIYTVADTTVFKIKGFSNRGTQLTERVLSFEADPAGGKKASVPLSYDEWNLTLSAYEGTNEILRGVTTVNLKKAPPAKLTFSLSTKNVETDGGLSLTVNGLNSSVKSYTAGLYDVNTDGLKYNLLTDENGVALADGKDLAAGTTSVTLSKTDIAPGSYIFKFIPYNNTVANKASREDLTPWSDGITVAPGRTTTAAITLTIMEKPNAPLGFNAVLVNSSKEDNDNYYTVKLSWTDNSPNEENFVLRIYEADGTEADDADLTVDGAQTALDKILVDSKKVAEFDKNFYGNDDYWVSGTLGMSTSSCEIRLPTGHLYEMTLAAKNRAGESDVLRRAAPAATIDTTVYTAFAADKRVNLQKITYVLLGGTRTVTTAAADPSGTPTVTTSTYDIVDYRIFDNAYTPWEPNDSTDKLSYKNHPWSSWVEKANSSTAASWSGFQDKIVYASYNQNLIVDYSIVNEYMTLQVTPSVAASLTGASLSGTTLTLDSKTNADIFDGDITFTISDTAKQKTGALDASNNPVYEDVTIDASKCQKIVLYINGVKVGERVGEHSYTCNLNSFNAVGTYNVSVVGQFNGREYSCTTLALEVNIIVE